MLPVCNKKKFIGRIVDPTAIRITDGPYIVNGDRDSIGVSGEFVGAGTVFSYRRAMPLGGQEGDLIDQPAVETILASGPINSSIDIMVSLKAASHRGTCCIRNEKRMRQNRREKINK